jgi:hypothetical protein
LQLTLRPSPWTSPVHIPEYNEFFEKSSAENDKFAPDVSNITFGDGNLSALGLCSLLGIAEEVMETKYGADGGVETIQKEIQDMVKSGEGTEDDLKNLQYVLTVS